LLQGIVESYVSDFSINVVNLIIVSAQQPVKNLTTARTSQPVFRASAAS
jgi:hypothetical protein